jgi:phosphate/phosphite/phosphonate ABC transporter binding protein
LICRHISEYTGREILDNKPVRLPYESSEKKLIVIKKISPTPCEISQKKRYPLKGLWEAIIRERNNQVMKKLSLFFLLISLFITGCREKDHNVTHHSSLTPKPSVKAGHSLKMVYIAGGGKHYMVERWQALGDYLSNKTGINIEVDERKNYEILLKPFKKRGSYWFGKRTYLCKVKKELNVIPVVKTVEKGKDTYKSFIVVRKDSGLKNFDDLRGKKFAFVDKQSTSGYLFPRVMMADLGVTKLEDYFSRIVFLDDHLSSIISVYNGYVDGGVVSSFVFDSPEAEKYQKDLTVIMETGGYTYQLFYSQK